ncbi:MAG: GTP 3',8-cyclase MoaA [Gammaproteobacteria bacterium]|nr:GTP 3',8-cyclase MoaA [Gammaproteobacteria bacterium]
MQQPIADWRGGRPRRPTDQRGRPLRDLRISVMDRCNFRCPYCMPEEVFHERFRFLRSPERLDFAEITRLASLLVDLGVTKLRITGGEPLLRPAISDLVADLATLPGVEDLALTTNGVLLEQHAVALKAAGLDRVTVSLDSLDPEVFARMSGGRAQLERVLAGIEAALEAGLAPVKINVVVQRGVNDHTVLDLLEHFRGQRVIVRFIEYMDVGTRNGWRLNDVVPSAELRSRIHARWPLESLDAGYRGEVARRWRFSDGEGEIGFISSVSAPFCGDCSRARLSSDGKLFTCLFAGEGADFRALLRGGIDDDTLRETLAELWQGRNDRYSELRARATRQDKAEMFYLGG